MLPLDLHVFHCLDDWDSIFNLTPFIQLPIKQWLASANHALLDPSEALGESLFQNDILKVLIKKYET